MRTVKLDWLFVELRKSHVSVDSIKVLISKIINIIITVFFILSLRASPRKLRNALISLMFTLLSSATPNMNKTISCYNNRYIYAPMYRMYPKTLTTLKTHTVK